MYASTRTEELAVVDWDDAQKATFLHMQFTAQHQFYQERYTKTDFLIILRDLLAEAAAAQKPVRIHVEKFNPALRLYERLGFAPIEDKGVYLFMEWAP